MTGTGTGYDSGSPRVHHRVDTGRSRRAPTDREASGRGIYQVKFEEGGISQPLFSLSKCCSEKGATTLLASQEGLCPIHLSQVTLGLRSLPVLLALSRSSRRVAPTSIRYLRILVRRRLSKCFTHLHAVNEANHHAPESGPDYRAVSLKEANSVRIHIG